MRGPDLVVLVRAVRADGEHERLRQLVAGPRRAATLEQVLNVTVLPLVLILLFSYVFNGAIILPGHGNYRDYLIAGIIAVNMGGTAQGAAVGLAVDLSTGLIDRFRSLPMSRAAVIAGRTLADLITTVLAVTVAVLMVPLTVWLYARRNRQ